MKCNLKELIYKPLAYESNDDYLAKLLFDYFHLLNLLWGKDGKKYTKSFLMYLTHSIFSTYAQITGEEGLEAESESINALTESVVNVEEFDKNALIFGVLGETLPGELESTSLTAKLGFLLAILERLGYTWDDVLTANQA